MKSECETAPRLFLTAQTKRPTLTELKTSPNDPLSVFGRTTLHEWIPATAILEQAVLMKELEQQEGYLG